jgi:hypothetical protein
MHRASVVDYISTLSKSELAQFFYEVSQQRRECRDFNEHGVEVTTICIAECYKMVNPGKASDQEPVINVLAPPAHPNDVGFPMDANQTGSCERCRLPIACATKIAICPVCGAEISCT